jgi:hypothetical protein
MNFDFIPFLSSYPVWVRIVVVLCVMVVAFVLILVPRTPPDQPRPFSTSQPVLTPPQERLLSLLAQYQRQFAADKLIIGRKDGKLW